MADRCPACNRMTMSGIPAPRIPIHGYCGCCGKPCGPLYCVNLVVEDELITENRSYHPMHKTLLLGWELLGGIPSAEVCIRREGRMVAYLKTDWRGNLMECEVYSPVSSRCTPINPRWSAFDAVFAK